MAFLRKDTPLAKTTDPGKGNISKNTIIPTKIDPTKMKVVDTRSVSRDSINNGRVVGRITENITTFKGNANTPARKPVTPTRTSVVSARKPVAKTPSKPTSVEDTKVVKTKTFTPVKENVAPIKTKSVGLMPTNKPEIKTLDASKLTQRGDDRTWKEKRKQEMLKKDYNRYKQGDETYDEFRERAKKSSEEISRKAKPKGKGFLNAGGYGGGGGCGCH